ncbi:effector-binding domain-containing protein [Tenacibaculum skagerrakense]|uniref:Effector-binding domain-containing protein n=1 Tax=Tenacibaculum skagerrakense TaxID=186571 RepID=A0A4R2P403_9FLAO|nr:GyrI-like domain-containing protein [Tenacibaculum skagerrakense]TCP28465.1 effector-binding domain-containing protein [Tenacibaculum skagerrakense]
MKILKYTLLFLLVLILFGLIYVSMQSSDYNVSRSKVIEQPISKVFNTVNDLKTWEQWGPWHDEDSTIVVTYGDKTVGVGASDSWTSKDGPGAMKTVAVEMNKSILQEMRFGDYEPSEILWGFEDVGNGTKVTWTMRDDKAPFFFKVFSALSGGWDNMLGPMLENGLNNLDGVVKAIPDKYTLSKVTIVDADEKIFVGYPFKIKIDQEAMMKAFTESLPKAGMHAANSGLVEGDFIPAALYHKWDEKTGETEFHIGLFLHKEMPLAEGMEKVTVAGGKYATISKFGNYGDGDYEAHTAIGKYLEATNMKSRFPLYEVYVNDPSKVKPEEIQTDIYYPIE